MKTTSRVSGELWPLELKFSSGGATHIPTHILFKLFLFSWRPSCALTQLHSTSLSKQDNSAAVPIASQASDPWSVREKSAAAPHTKSSPAPATSAPALQRSEHTHTVAMSTRTTLQTVPESLPADHVTHTANNIAQPENPAKVPSVAVKTRSNSKVSH